MKKPKEALALRMRHGKPGGGKGPLVQTDVSGTIATGNDQTIFQDDGEEYIVRRLMPIEYERLQGFPDNWTRIPFDKVSLVKAKTSEPGAFIAYYDEDTGEPVWKKLKTTHIPAEKCPDEPRYRALGNSMAVPVIRYLGQRIELVNEIAREIEDERKSRPGAFAPSADDQHATSEIG